MDEDTLAALSVSVAELRGIVVTRLEEQNKKLDQVAETQASQAKDIQQLKSRLDVFGIQRKVISAWWKGIRDWLALLIALASAAVTLYFAEAKK